jgi:hypothetical protein
MNAAVLNNNLGGFDPALPKNLLYGNVGVLEATGQTINIEVSNSSYYRPWRTIRNGLNGEFAQINLDSPKEGSGEQLNFVTLLIRFLDGATGALVVVDRVHMSFYDFDQGFDGNGRECFSTRDFSHIQLGSTDSQIVDGVDTIDPLFSAYCATQQGYLADNPTSPFSLTDHQRSKMIEVTYDHTSEIEMRFGVHCILLQRLRPQFLDGGCE